MSWFKDLVESDVKSVFLDENEFAETHNINGKDVTCVVDKNLNQEHPSNDFLGVFVNMVRIYVAAGEIPVPAEGALLRIDGSRHLVRTVSMEQGMLVITAEANEQ